MSRAHCPKIVPAHLPPSCPGAAGRLITVERLAPYLPGATAAERRQKAGVLMASRVLTDSLQSDRLLEGARQFFAAGFAEV
jgi:hypothetical protein